jgi:hypothetical protein
VILSEAPVGVVLKEIFEALRLPESLEVNVSLVTATGWTNLVSETPEKDLEALGFPEVAAGRLTTVTTGLTGLSGETGCSTLE